MSKMKYLVVLAVCVGMALLVGAPAFATDQVFFTENLTTNPAWTTQGAWEYGKPTGVDRDPLTGHTANFVYGYNIFGPYGKNMPQTNLTTPALVCTGKVGVRLNFWRWLNVLEGDTAIVQVSNNGTAWTKVWANTDEDDPEILDNAWVLVGPFDISAVADNQATVYVRWGMASDNLPDTTDPVYDSETGGWNIDDITMTASGDDTLYSWNMSTSPFAAGWTQTAAGWEWGLAAAGTSGQLGSEIPTPILHGADPALDSAGVAGNILGFEIGGNYYNDMAVTEWVMTPALDFEGERDIALSFERYLSVEDSTYDSASIQVTNDISAQEMYADNPDDPYELAAEDRREIAIDASEWYEISLSYDWGVESLESGDSFIMQVSYDGGDSWTTLNTIAGPVAGPTLVSVGPVAINDLAADNPDFMIAFEMVKPVTDPDVDTGFLDDILVEGVKWNYVWQSPTAGIFDGEDATEPADRGWQSIDLDISAFADNEEEVYVRWGMGPTDDWPNTQYGGWSIDDVVIAAGSSAWKAGAVAALPTALKWGGLANVTVASKNVGTATWTEGVELFEVSEDDDTDAISRWGVDSIALGAATTVAPGASFNWTAGIKAPPLSTVVYSNDPVISPTAAVIAPADPALSQLALNWNLADELGWVPTYIAGDTAEGGVQISRFPDDMAGTGGAWARFWIEELAGAVPFVVQGYDDGTYRPTIQLDRSAISVYIQRAADLPLVAYQGLFRDVPDDWWAALQIEACKDAGIIAGYPPDFITFQPTTLVNREAMAKFIANGAGLATPAPPSTWEAFTDVAFDNVFAPFIKACADNDIVLGYDDGGGNFSYRPAVIVTRDQLAVYVWRAFVAPSPAAVCLGGPAITDLDPEAVSWIGLQSVGSVADEFDENYAYAVFDAMRMGTPSLNLATNPTGTWQVKFDLRNAATPTQVVYSYERILTAAEVASAITAARTSGVPYLPVAVAIPTPLHGEFQLVASAWDASQTYREIQQPRPMYTILGTIYNFDFESVTPISGWTVTGLPDEDPATTGDPANDLKAVDFVQTQKITRTLTTVGWSNITVSFYMGCDGLETGETMRVEWSPNAGTTWNTLATVTGSPDWPEDPLTFTLPSSANNNPNFMIRAGLSASSDEDDHGYLDDLVIKGS